MCASRRSTSQAQAHCAAAATDRAIDGGGKMVTLARAADCPSRRASRPCSFTADSMTDGDSPLLGDTRQDALLELPCWKSGRSLNSTASS